MRIEAPNRAAVLYVAEHMRERDRQEFLALSPLSDGRLLAQTLAKRYGEQDDTFLVVANDGAPIAVGAMVEHRPHVVTLMFFATDGFPAIATALTKFIVQRLFPAYRERGVHRIECASLDGYDEVHRWIEVLGLKREAVMPAYGKSRETFIQFAWVAA